MASLSSYLKRDFLREHLVEIGYIAVGVVLFFVFLAASFPYAELLSSVLGPAGLEISSQGQQVSFPFGVRMTGVSLREVSGRRLLIKSSDVQVSPSLLSFLMLSPGVNVKASLYGGVLRVRMRRRGNLIALDFNLENLHPGRYPALRALGASLRGTLSAKGSLELSPEDIAADHGNVAISGSGIAVSAIRGMAPVRLGEIHAVAALEHGKLTLRSAQTSGGDLMFSGRGVMMLSRVLAESEMAIRFQLRAAPAAQARLAFLLGMLPHPPGPTPYLIGGTLAAPTLS
jgi:type II secretion system protein N